VRRRAFTVLLVLVGAACTRGIDEGSEVLNTPSTAPTTPAPATVSASPSVSATPTESDARASIAVRAPRRGSEIWSPVLVRGVAVTASGRVIVRVLDTGGAELAAMEVDVSCGAGCRGTFEAQLAFFVPSAGAGTVRVAEVAPGGEEGVPVDVRVTLIPGV
jgi:hypothetical protein